ncbi:bacillithiol biosynthesis cysteine-adding enzyme BshC [Ferruginibacter yonginensis]|uniref:Putative cysteine ligase BshC n=1 Tax=Ferruginibacter yonginensis TaxID=1310416 RepID=A0ABV8QS20_9BACT
MNFTAENIPYQQTGAFSTLVIDYLNENPLLKDLYRFQPTLDGVKEAVAARQFAPVNRKILHSVLTEQYTTIETNETVQANIDALLSNDTFTVCTAHQPNIFTGHLYFIYKIIHAIKLSNHLNESIPNKKFVPVYYMGTEDADLEELGEVYINQTTYHWQTNQKGAVGNMLVDKALINLINEISGQIAIEPFGQSIIDVLRNCYTLGNTIALSTFKLVHQLFANFGLVVLLPEHTSLKKIFTPIVEKELTAQFSQNAVATTVANFPQGYKLQTVGRPINLFYLKDDIRERIEADGDYFSVVNTNLHFTKDEILAELQQHPERFSPNVILRPVYQETILPNVAFIGGGGEMAYWLELKKVFEAVDVFFPPLILRNSYTILNKTCMDLMQKLSLQTLDIFKTPETLLNNLVKKQSTLQLHLQNEIAALQQFYATINNAATLIDASLNTHVNALATKASQKLLALEKKMLKAEKKKFEAQQRQILKLKSFVNPTNNLQERVDNVVAYYSKYGNEFISAVYNHAAAFENGFTILKESDHG